jgi:isoleucyl-tRNA synthetase
VVVYEVEEPCYASTAIEGLKIKIRKAEGSKCERCWTHSITVGKAKEGEAICERCTKVLYSS